MTAAAVDGRELPLIAVICSVPVVYEALREALEPIADVRVFPADDGTAGLLRSMRPDAAIVDNDDGADQAEPVARELDFSLVHLALRQRYLRVFRDGAWHAGDSRDGFTAEAVRNIIAGGLYGRKTMQ
jgi:hypothetical protein